MREGAAAAGVLLGGENALPCFVPGGVDQYALDRIVYNTKPWSPPLQVRLTCMTTTLSCYILVSLLLLCMHQGCLLARPVQTVAALFLAAGIKHACEHLRV